MKRSDSSDEDEKYHLLSRTPPEDYIEEWTKLVESPPLRREINQSGSILVFRLFDHHLALPAKSIKHVTEPKKTHRIPTARPDLVLGVVNINGQLRTLISLHAFFEIKSSLKTIPYRESSPHPRMLVVSEGTDEFVFFVDELFGVFPFDASSLKNVPPTLSRSAVNYLKGIIDWGEATPVGLIDEGLFFYGLRKIFHAE